MLLMCIPILGQILMIVWACGGCRKLQKRNLARAGLILLVISLILSLILGFAFRGALKGFAGEADGEGGTSSGSILGRLLGGGSSGAEQTGSDAGGELDDLTALAGLLNGLSAESGEDAGGSLEALLENAADVNREAEQHSDGWPSSLPEYPGGAMSAVESYRTEFTGTTREEMHAYIDTLKNDGFAYTDFYGFGMTEAEMLDIDGWWGTDGNLYLSLSYLDGTVTIDHTTELPNLEDYFS